MIGARGQEQINVRIPAGNKKLVKDAAIKNHWSVNTYVNVAIEEKLQRDGVLEVCSKKE